jgi:hypothetical protein
MSLVTYSSRVDRWRFGFDLSLRRRRRRREKEKEKYCHNWPKEPEWLTA